MEKAESRGNRGASKRDKRRVQVQREIGRAQAKREGKDNGRGKRKVQVQREMGREQMK